MHALVCLKSPMLFGLMLKYENINKQERSPFVKFSSGSVRSSPGLVQFILPFEFISLELDTKVPRREHMYLLWAKNLINLNNNWKHKLSHFYIIKPY